MRLLRRGTVQGFLLIHIFFIMGLGRIWLRYLEVSVKTHGKK